MKLKRIFAMTTALCMASVMLASCGDSADSSSEASSDAASSAAEDSAAEDSAAEDSAAEDSVADDSTEDGADDVYIDEYTGLECQIPSADYTPVTEFQGYDAFLMFADTDWMWSNFSGQGYPEDDRGDGAFGIDADITGDGEYTVSITIDSVAAEDPVLGATNAQLVYDGEYILPSSGATVFCVDITGICDGTTAYDGEALAKQKLEEGDDANVNKYTMGKYTGQELNVQVTSIKADGEEIEFDPSKIVYGNIEDDNNCYRIEIYNAYGLTVNDPPIDPLTLAYAKSLEVTFTIEGLSEDGGDAAADAGEATDAEATDEAAADEAAE